MFKSVVSKISVIKKRSNRFTLKHGYIMICIVYLISGFLWIYFSDRLASSLFKNKNMLLIVNTYKGFLYIIITAIMLYFLIDNLLKKVYLAEKKLNESNDELSITNEELQAYVQQLTASDQELRHQYDQIIEYDKKLIISEQKYKTLITQMQLGFALYEGSQDDDISNYRLVEANESHERLTGLVEDDVIGKTFAEIHTLLEPMNFEKIKLTVITGEPSHYERFQKKTDKYYEIIAYRPKKTQLAVIVNDITKRKNAEEAIKISEDNFRNLFLYSSDAIFIIDDNKVINCNSAAVSLLGFDTQSFIIGKSFTEFTTEKQPDGQSSIEKLNSIYDYSLKYGKHKFEWWYQKTDGSLMPSEVMMTTIHSYGKKIFHALCRDISERKQLEDRLQFLSYHDQLTGLYNRRYFEQELIRLDRAEYLPLTITMADINGLKLINDSFGHAIGDDYIRKTAETIKKAFRSNDIVCRLSGDEFVILSPNTTSDEVESIINNFNKIAQNEKVKSIKISISFGYETKYSEDIPSAEVLKKAEDYMYKKKLFESPSMRGKTIHTIITTLHEKNPREERHSRRVSELCERMGYVLGFQEDKIRELKTVGLLHDIGKVAIEERILNKEGMLTSEEWEEIKKHTQIGYRILGTVNNMSEIAEYVLAHHERWDGKGYPKGLKELEIPIESRIIAIADAYDAMVSERSYRNALSKEYAINELKNNAGIQFCPDLVLIFIERVLNDPQNNVC